MKSKISRKDKSELVKLAKSLPNIYRTNRDGVPIKTSLITKGRLLSPEKQKSITGFDPDHYYKQESFVLINPYNKLEDAYLSGGLTAVQEVVNAWVEKAKTLEYNSEPGNKKGAIFNKRPKGK